MKIVIPSFLTLIFIVLLVLSKKEEDRPFNSVELNGNVYVLNSKIPSYYDTIVIVALSQTDIDQARVYLYKLSESTKNKFEGSLKAHLRYVNGDFYLYIDDHLGRREAISVISHEVIHMLQYYYQDIVYDDVSGNVFWKGEVYSLDKEYDSRPWEQDAFQRQGQIADKVFNILY